MKIDVGNAPFLVEKLGVRVLPCVICFVDGVGVERVVGFEGLGDGFETGELERRFVKVGVLEGEKRGKDVGVGGREGRGVEKGGAGGKGNAEDDDDEWD